MKIALAGHARSGKDTLAGMLLEVLKQHGYEVKPYALADPIKEVIHALVGVSQEVAETQKDIDMTYVVSVGSQARAIGVFDAISARKRGLLPPFHEFWGMFEALEGVSLSSGRFMYQGTLRNLYQLFGTEFGRSLNPASWTLLVPDNVLVTDVRFVNEAELLAEQGFTIVRVVRNTATTSGRISASAQAHASELEIDAIVEDFSVDNAYSLDQLKVEATNLVGKLKRV